MAYNEAYYIEDNTHWEKVASTKWGAYVSDIERRAILKAHELIREPATALDIGAEGGRWSRLLADLGWSLICTDINEDTLAKCKTRIPNANCILVKPEDNSLPCESESVSLLLCIEVHAAIQSDWFINESLRILQNDGLIVGVFSNLLSFRGFFTHLKAKLTGKLDWYRHSYHSWRKKLSGRGYSILYEEGYCWFPFKRDSNSIFVPFFLRLERWLSLHKIVSISPCIVFIARKSLNRN